jgi:hypothetical protein
MEGGGEVLSVRRQGLVIVIDKDFNDEELLAYLPIVVGVHVIAVEALTNFVTLRNGRQC